MVAKGQGRKKFGSAGAPHGRGGRALRGERRSAPSPRDERRALVPVFNSGKSSPQLPLRRACGSSGRTATPASEVCSGAEYPTIPHASSLGGKMLGRPDPLAFFQIVATFKAFIIILHLIHSPASGGPGGKWADNCSRASTSPLSIP